jgi:hypothetical protein
MDRLLRLSLASSLALAACHSQVSGSGVLGEEVRTVAPFDAVDISLGIEATVTASAAAQSVILSGDENLLQYVLTTVEAGVLTTGLHGTSGIESIHPLRIVAEAKALHAVRAREAAMVDVKNAGNPSPGFVFNVEATGAGQVQLQGAGGDRLLVNLSNGSGLDAWAYPVNGATVTVGGGSTLRIHSTGDVEGSVSGASRLEITGGGTCAALTLSRDSSCTVH